MEDPEFVDLMNNKLNFPLAYQDSTPITEAIVESNAGLATIAGKE